MSTLETERSNNYGPIDPLSVFSFTFAVAVLFHFLAHPVLPYINITDFFGFLSVFFALLLLLKPRSTIFLCLMALPQIIHYVIKAPMGSNHYIMDTFMNVAICMGALFFLRGKLLLTERTDFYNSFASTGRFLLVFMYFFGIFHKINPDFLNPEVSCAVVLMNNITSVVGLDNVSFINYAAIWGTFIIEGIAMLVLFSRRWKYWGFVVGIPFHIIISFTGYKFFMNYSSLALALYCLFLPREFYAGLNNLADGIRTKLNLSPERFWKIARIFMVCMIILVAIYAAISYWSVGVPHTPERFIVYSYKCMPIFAIYSAILYLLVLKYAKNVDTSVKEPMYSFPKPLLILLPVLFVLNGFGPYLGWKTESSISMFSHLHTEGSKTNHYLFKEPPQIFDYQKKLVRIISSPNNRLQKYADNDLQMVYFELQRFVTEHPDVPVVYEVDGVRYEDTSQVEPVSLLMRKLLLFKPVDFKWPKVCTH